MPLPRAFRARRRRIVLAVLPVLLAVAPGALPRAAAAAGPNVAIVSSSKWGPDDINAIHIVGEASNNDTIKVQFIRIDVSLLDGAGVQRGSDVTFADADILAPGERSPFEAILLAPPTWFASYRLSVSATSTTSPPNHKFSVAAACADPPACRHVTGTVTNMNTTSADHIRVIGTFYQDSTRTRTIDQDSEFLQNNATGMLLSGQSAGFEIFRDPSAPAAGDIAFFAESDSPPSLPVVTLNAPALSFGNQLVGTQSAAQVLSLTNTGNDLLHVGAITVAGTNAGDFLVVLDQCSNGTFAVGGGCNLQVVFQPTGSGPRAAVLNIPDDANDAPQTLALTGVGEMPLASVPASLDFGPVVIPSQSSKNLAVANPGNADLHVGTVSLAPLSAGFSITADGCSGATVAPGTACVIGIQFAPGNIGPAAATVTVPDDANAKPSQQKVGLTGAGVGAPLASLSTSAITYGNQLVGTAGNGQTVGLSNTGSLDLHISSVTLDNTADFLKTADTCSSATVRPGSACTVTIALGPAATGPRIGHLSVNDDAFNGSVQTVTLSGVGTIGGQYHAVAPTRILDTRSAGGPLQPQGVTILTVAGQGPLPATGVSAVVLNVTVTDTTSPGYLTIFPTGQRQPLASSLNWPPGQTVPNLVEVALGSGGQVTIFNAAGSTDVIADIEGYVGTASPSPSGEGFFSPLPPNRVLDTRNGNGAAAAPVGGPGSITVPIRGRGGVPAQGVSAVVLNVTVTNPSAASYLTVFPSGARQPLASNLNYVRGQTVPNRVIVKLGFDGAVTIFNAAGTVDIIADVGGWFTDGSSGATSGFVGVSPTRVLDTRDGTGPLTAGEVRPLNLVGANSPLPGMSSATPPVAVVLNVTVTNPSAPSYLTVFPAGATPLASDLNFVAGQTIANLVVVKVAPDGTIKLFNAAGTVHVIVDVVGWYG